MEPAVEVWICRGLLPGSPSWICRSRWTGNYNTVIQTL